MPAGDEVRHVRGVGVFRLTRVTVDCAYSIPARVGAVEQGAGWVMLQRLGPASIFILQSMCYLGYADRRASARSDQVCGVS
jgi:hypothetical protein